MDRMRAGGDRGGRCGGERAGQTRGSHLVGKKRTRLVSGELNVKAEVDEAREMAILR